MKFVRSATVVLACFASSAVSQVANHVVVSEVFYLGASGANAEFVELYNPTGSGIALTGLSLQTEVVAGTNVGSWHVDLSGATIQAHGYLLIGQSAVSPAPDLAIPATKGLNNSSFRAAVRIFNTTTSSVVDLVAWDATNTLGLEGTPYTAAGVTSTNPKSIERKARSSSTSATMLAADALLGNGYDTNDNSVDLTLRDVPQPQNSLSATEQPFSGPDTDPPFVLALRVLSPTSIQLQFNEAVDSVTSSTAGNYALNGSVSVSAAFRDAFVPSRVVLTTTTTTPGVYALTVSGVKDTSGNAIDPPQVISFASGVITIAEARALGAGASVRIRGTVTVGNEFASPSYVQDSTGAIAVFNNSFSQRAKTGDVWEVAGGLKDFNGLLEVDPLTDSVLVSTGNPPPAPLLITSAGLTESTEARFSRINRVKFQATGSFGSGMDSSYTAADAFGMFIVRVDKDSNVPGSPIPADSVNIVGVVNDFNGSYRLMPRSFADIGVVDPVPGQTWTDMATARSYTVGTPVRVRGIVTHNQTGTTNTVFMQDATGGMALFSTVANGLVAGDSAEVRGTMDVFNNLQEVKNIDSVWTFGTGHPLPPPRDLAVPQASEASEAMLVRFRNVRFAQSGLFAGNTTYQISDGVSQLDVRIPTGSSLIGASIPPGAVHATGVLGQFQARYQLIPRSSADLTALPGPQITASPIVDSLFDTGFRVLWTTLLPGTSTVLFGPGDSIADSISVGTEATAHEIIVAGLRPGRVYTYRVVSTNSSGVSDAGPNYVVTTSPASTGEIRVAFNYAVDTALPFAEQAEGSVDLGALILERISAATRSIDLALYSLDDFSASATDIAQRLADSLVAAKGRGVKVRMVFHDRASTGALNTLIYAGIPVLKRTVPSSGSGMHNKFWIFDGRDTVGAADDWVVTGSWNATDDGTYRDAQNAVFFQDQSLAAVYTKEFEEMFGSATDVSNSGAARFGPTKRNDTPHWTLIGGTKVEVYFSPSDRTSAAITRVMGSAQYNVLFGLLSFTRDEIANELVARKNAGAVVRGIIDNINDVGSEYPFLQSAGIDILPSGHGTVTGQFHHKYGIVDPFHDASDPLVVTGSHNWSSAADTDNDENTVIVHSGAVARQYVREFSKRYSESGGTGSITSAEEDSGVPENPVLDAPFPNPFNPSTTVRFSLPRETRVRLRVVDVLGRTVENILEGTRPAGVTTVIWNADRVATGTYLLVFDAGGARLTRKIVLLK